MKKLRILLCMLMLPSVVLLAQSTKSKHTGTKPKKEAAADMDSPDKTAEDKPKPKETKTKPTDESVIREMLANQAKQWNKGNIEGYMSGYWDNDSMLFIGAKGLRYGYQNTLERYKEAYPDKDHMGKLISTITKIEPLSKEYYFVVGTWELERKAGNVNGSYTLLIRKIGGQWVIVCDHSS